MHGDDVILAIAAARVELVPHVSAVDGVVAVDLVARFGGLWRGGEGCWGRGGRRWGDAALEGDGAGAVFVAEGGVEGVGYEGLGGGVAEGVDGCWGAGWGHGFWGCVVVMRGVRGA